METNFVWCILDKSHIVSSWHIIQTTVMESIQKSDLQILTST